MRISSFNWRQADQKYIIIAISVIIAAIISGIVLFITVGLNDYFYNFADIYIFYLFNFKNGNIFASHFLSELLYFYIIFLIAYFAKNKYMVLIPIFIKVFFSALYASMLFAAFFTEGVLAAIIVFIPCCALSVFLYFAVGLFRYENCKGIIFVLPAVLALVSSLCVLVVVNVIFRCVIIIV